MATGSDGNARVDSGEVQPNYRSMMATDRSNRASNGRDPAVAALLSFVWPGLGQAYRGVPRRAAMFALPPLAAVVVVVALVALLGGPVFVAYLVAPQWAALATLLIIAAALWWAWAILDAGRPQSRASLVASIALLSLVILGAGYAGSVVWSLYQAGVTISQPIHGPTPTPDPSASASPSPSPTHSAPPLNTSGRVTILFLGRDAGSGGRQLTDTIQVASFDARSGEIVMISVPRDTGQLPLYNGGTWNDKINALMAYADKHPDEFPDGGIGTLKRQIEYIIGIPIDYYATVDFGGFERLVDMVGGVDVVLERAIRDRTYSSSPTEQGFFMEPGEHHLEGATALKYVRSRHGPGNSDFQRARRQQQVLLALRHKIDDPSVLANLPSIVGAAAQMVRTDVPLDRLPDIVALLQKSTAAGSDTYVLQPRAYAEVIPRSEIGNIYMTRLKMDAVAELSIRLFGDESRYAPLDPES
ncbi:hypothetical protein BH23CHL7_BH23CHL7_00400 [soil metagenome]